MSGRGLKAEAPQAIIPAMERRVMITRPLPGDPVRRLAEAGFGNVWVNPRDEKLSRPDLLAAVAGVHAIIATPADTLINAELFDAAGPQLIIVSNYAVGVDNVDLTEARRRGIIVGNTPGAVTEPTADAAWLLLLAGARRAREGLDLARSGRVIMTRRSIAGMMAWGSSAFKPRPLTARRARGPGPEGCGPRPRACSWAARRAGGPRRTCGGRRSPAGRRRPASGSPTPTRLVGRRGRGLGGDPG